MRKLLNASALLLCALALASCKPARRPGLQISLFVEIDVLTIMKEHLKEFERREGIRVEPLYIPFASYSEKLVAQMAARQAPDVIWVEAALFPELNHHGVFQPLGPFLKKDPLDLQKYYPDVVRRFSKGGEVFAIPQDTAPVACLYYNKDAFRQAGIRPPKGDWTWKEFLSACKKLVKKDAKGSVERWAFMDNYGPDWAGMIYSNGGRLVDDVEKPTRCVMDEPAAVEAIQFLSDLMNTHQVSPTASHRSQLTNMGQDLFIAGKMAMFRSGIWAVPPVRKVKEFEWDILPFPSGPRARGGKGGWNTGGSGYAISRDSRRPEQAWKLVKFLASRESQEGYARTGFVQPGYMDLASSDAFLKSVPPANKGFLRGAVARSVYAPAHPRWREAEASIISVDLEKYLGKGGDALPVMREITRKVNAKLFANKE